MPPLQCDGYGRTCIIDMQGAPNPVFKTQPNSILHVDNVRIINGATLGDGAAVQVGTEGRRACEWELGGRGRGGGGAASCCSYCWAPT